MFDNGSAMALSILVAFSFWFCCVGSTAYSQSASPTVKFSNSAIQAGKVRYRRTAGRRLRMRRIPARSPRSIGMIFILARPPIADVAPFYRFPRLYAYSYSPFKPKDPPWSERSGNSRSLWGQNSALWKSRLSAGATTSGSRWSSSVRY